MPSKSISCILSSPYLLIEDIISNRSSCRFFFSFSRHGLSSGSANSRRFLSGSSSDSSFVLNARFLRCNLYGRDIQQDHERKFSCNTSKQTNVDFFEGCGMKILQDFNFKNIVVLLNL